MCEWNKKDKAVVLTPEGMREVNVDACLKPMVEGLGKAGVVTVGCCCGHGRDCPTILLEDGRVVYILKDKPWEVWKLIVWAFGRLWRQIWLDARIRMAGIRII